MSDDRDAIPSYHRPRTSLIHSVDPRARIIAAVLFSFLVAVLGRFSSLGIALAAAVTGAGLARLDLGTVLRRLLRLNQLVLILAAVLALTAGGAPWAQLGPIALSQSGLQLAGIIMLKSNAIVLGLLVLLGTMEITVLGHALAHLHVPQKLTHLLLLTVRYIDVLQRERVRLAEAMKIRAFRPRANWHTYRSYGYLAGMLLVRSHDRAERIVAAMKCRGFRGRFYLLDHFAFSRGDLAFAAGFLATLFLLAWTEWGAGAWR